MGVAFAVFNQGLHVVVAEAWTKTHPGGLHPEQPSFRLPGVGQKGESEQFVERIPKRCSAGAAFLADALEDVRIQSDSGSDAHDAFILASLASNGKYW